MVFECVNQIVSDATSRVCVTRCVGFCVSIQGFQLNIKDTRVCTFVVSFLGARRVLLGQVVADYATP